MAHKPFQLVTDYAPGGDQPQAIAALVEGLECGQESQTLLGVTGSGKTFTMANVIQAVQRPTLILSHNKTLAAQLYNEMKGFFPYNAVEYFISYYDYYQPEAYIPRTDTYIEKTASINDNIDRLRHSATRSLYERRDVVVIASVSCIYGLGAPEAYFDAAIRVSVGDELDRQELLRHLVRTQYTRVELDFKRATFRVRGDVIEIFPAYEETKSLKLTLFGDEVEALVWVDALSGDVIERVDDVVIYPAIHYVTNKNTVNDAIDEIMDELKQQEAYFRSIGKNAEADRIRSRTYRDVEMIKQVGYCPGIENYSRVFDRRPPGTPPKTLMDYFANDFLMMIDESHVTLPQLRGMYHGDQARKNTLVDYGFRLPCARDNRPLRYEEFCERIGQRLFISATPTATELEQSSQVVEQVIRPTGLLDPLVSIHPTANQVDTLLAAIRERVAKDERVLITTLTKRMAEDLTEYYRALNVRVRFLHSDIKPLERIEILRDLRLGTFDVLVGVNLLREGLDLPEVSLVAIMDADKEGFLRSESSLIQTIGRAARNACGEVFLFADKITDSMQRAMKMTSDRREKQHAFNQANGIVPKTIKKPIANGLLELMGMKPEDRQKEVDAVIQQAETAHLSDDQLHELITQLNEQMEQAATLLEFEKAAALRDQIGALKNLLVVTA
jgi:excinuclease ABC subunit B